MSYRFPASILGVSLLFAGSKLSHAASLPAAPPGFTWQYASSSSYTDSDSGSVTLNASGNFATPSVTPISQSLSLTTFNEASAPSGQFYSVTSSTFTTNLIGSTNATLFNFSGVPDSFYGALSLAGVGISGSSGASAGPATSTLSRVSSAPMAVAPFAGASFTDFVSGLGATSISLSDTGAVAVNNGSNIGFTFTGNSVAFFQASSGFTGPLWAVSGTASFDASLTTNYDIYALVPIVPEPSAAMLMLAGLACSFRRRRSA